MGKYLSLWSNDVKTANCFNRSSVRGKGTLRLLGVCFICLALFLGSSCGRHRGSSGSFVPTSSGGNTEVSVGAVMPAQDANDLNINGIGPQGTWVPGSKTSFGNLSVLTYYPRGKSAEPFERSVELVTSSHSDGLHYFLKRRYSTSPREVYLYEVYYPEETMRPVSVNFGNLADSDSAITFYEISTPGIISIAVITLPGGPAPAFKSDGTIAEIVFSEGQGPVRSVSRAPKGSLNQVQLRSGQTQGATIAWEEKMAGDTDNSGEVNIADIVPIAEYFFKDSSFSIGANLADADRSGIVDIADITVIAEHFFQLLTGYAVYRVEANSLAEAETLMGAVSPSSHYAVIQRPLASPGGPRPMYTFTDSNPSPRAYYAVAPTDGSEFGIRSNVTKGYVPGPRVTITAPIAGEEISDMQVTVSADIESVSAVTEVTFALLGAEPFARLTDPPWVAVLDTTALADGPTTVEVVARDENNQTGGDSVTFIITGHNPIVTWNRPAEGEQVEDTLFISVSATGIAEIVAVDVYLDDGTTPMLSFSAPPYEESVPALEIPAGRHYLTATATDTLSRRGSATRGFVVTGANIQIISPADGATIFGDAVLVSVTTDAPPGETVGIYLDDSPTPLAEKTSAPYEFFIRAFDIPAGQHFLRAKLGPGGTGRADSITVTVPSAFEQCALSMGKQVSDLNFAYYGQTGANQPPEYANPAQLILPNYLEYWRDDHTYFPQFVSEQADALRSASSSLEQIISWSAKRIGSPATTPAFTPTIDPTEPLAEATISLLNFLGDSYNEGAIRSDASDVPLELQRAIAGLLQYFQASIPYRNTFLQENGFWDAREEYYSWAHWILVPTEQQVNNHRVSGNMTSLMQGALLVGKGIDAFRSSISGEYPGTYDFTVDTSAGRIIVRDSGPHTYDNRAYLLIVDGGGNDTYNAPAGANASAGNPISVCIDLGGSDIHNRLDDPNDVDRNSRPSNDNTSQQGVGRMGIGILADFGSGNDDYRSVRLSQGFGIYGVGVLYDEGGNDSYLSEALSQGSAFNGVGLLIDRDGSDEYRMVAYGQGFGFVLGVGALYDNDDAGFDTFYAEPDSTNAMPEYKSPQDNSKNANFCQGAGFGLRGNAIAGGLGFLMTDGNGSDSHIGGIFAISTAYYYATGMLYDAGGDDSYDGDWYAVSGNAHQSACILFERAGNDTYDTDRSVGLGGGHDVSVGWFVDVSGNDTYTGSAYTLGGSNQCGAGYFIDVSGDDSYDSESNNQGLGRGNFSNELVNDFWQMHLYRLQHYFNWAIFIDGGGNDIYAEKYRSIPTLDPANDRNIIFRQAGNLLTWKRAQHGNGTENPGNPPPQGPNSYWANEYGIGVDTAGSGTVGLDLE